MGGSRDRGLDRRGHPVAAIAAISIAAEAAAIAVAEATAAAAIVTLAVAVDLAHHGRGALLEFLDAHREVAQHFFVEPLLPLDLVDHGRRRIEIHEREVRLAVLAQPIGEGLDAPLLELGDLAAHLLDDALEMVGQFFDLLRADVLARHEDVFIEGHGMPFPGSNGTRPGA